MANSWGTISFEIPDFLKDVRDAINSIAEWLVTILDIALVALNFVKTFLVGFLDPIASILQALIDELNRLLRDLSQLGLYITGDWNLLDEKNREELQGGYQEYERRMIARLTDRTDPSRPDVSGATTVLSLFFYTSVDLSEWNRLVRTILALLAYFKQIPKLASGHPVPSITNILYGASAANVMDFGDLGAFFSKAPTPPAVALVKWVLNSAMKKDPFLPSFAWPPGGFVVTVSTVAEGIRVVYDRPQGNQTKKPVAGTSTLAQPREYGDVQLSTGGMPFILHGGAEMLAGIPSNMTYNFGIQDRALKDGVTRVYGLLGSSRQPVPLDLLEQNGTFYFQRTFYVSSAAAGLAWMTGEYSILLKGEEMPRAAHVETLSDGKLQIVDDGPAATLYVRVAACDSTVSARGSFKYLFSPLDATLTGPPISVSVEGVDSATDSSSTQLGDFSAPRPVVFPNNNTKEYLEALRVALLILVLSRPDLKPVDTLTGTLSTKTLNLMKSNETIVEGVALQRCGLEGVQHLTGVLYGQRLPYDKAMSLEETNPTAFRTDLLERIQQAAHDIYSKTGPMPDVEAFVVQSTKFLRTVTWRTVLGAAHPDYLSGWGDTDRLPAELLDSTLLGSLQQNALLVGLARNPFCAVGGNELAFRQKVANSTVTEDRLPQMQEGMLDHSARRWKDRIVTEVPKAEVEAFLRTCPRGLKRIYEKAPRNDAGDLIIPPEWNSILDEASREGRMKGSADMSPVFYFGLKQTVPTKILYCRSLFAKSDLVTGLDANQGSILQQASLTLRVAGAAIRRSPADGAWLYIRWFDTMPGVEDFLAMLAQWMEAVRAAIQSIIDTIRKYIEFLEARIVELQQLIRRINAVLQSILGFSFQIPKCSALVMVSNGTGGVLADLVSSDNKPSDSPLAYGAGVAVVVPLFPSFVLLDLLLALWKAEPGPPGPGGIGQDPSTVQGITGVPEVVPEPVEPDVL